MGLINLGEEIIKLRAERDKLKADVLAWAVACKNLERENKDLRLQSDTLIDDNKWQQDKIERLEDEKDDMLLEREYYKNGYKNMTRICKEMERENEKLLHELDNEGGKDSE